MEEHKVKANDSKDRNDRNGLNDLIKPMESMSSHEPTSPMKPMKPMELLAPAGDFEKLKVAILYGADAVYLAGQDFGLRAFSKNFSIDELGKAIVYAHARGVKVYQTLNIMAHPGDFEPMERYLKALKDELPEYPDAFIISDPGVFQLCGEILPEVERHISTQASVTNAGTANFWAAQGATRVILARELRLHEIRAIRDATPPTLELETFVHGAMCMAYSGRCLLSNLLTGRGGNQGECAQPCRWRYSFAEEKRDEVVFDLAEDERGSYFFSSADLCMIEHIDKLQAAGVHSLKIEGRMKGAYYAAMTTRVYRQALDRLFEVGADEWEADPTWLEELGNLSHRRYSTGFYFAGPGEQPQLNFDESYQSEATVVGLLLDHDEDVLYFEQRNKLLRGENLELVTPSKIYTLNAIDLYDERGIAIDEMPHPQALFQIHGVIPQDDFVPGSFLRRKGGQQI